MKYKAYVSLEIVKLQMLLEEACKGTSREGKINELMVDVFNNFGALAVSDVEANNPENKNFK